MSEQWQRVEEVLQGALDCATGERAAFVEEACGNDSWLRGEATSLIRAYDEAGDFLEQPAIARDARVLINELPDTNIGRSIGPYRILSLIGAGGMSEVYLAQDTRLGRLVALKILPSYFVSESARLSRFQREARAASGLNHPNILTIHEVGETDEAHFIATEFIDGQTIRELISERDLSVEVILDISVQVGEALAVAHAAGIIHRDIKPENIMRRTDRIVKILDFGIAKLTEQLPAEFSDESTTLIKAQTEMGVVLGTVGYMSPEQARGFSVDERTDIWSFGIVLYEMLARRAPFTGATRLDTLVAILEREPLPLIRNTKETPAPFNRLQRIIFKALRKERSQRYATATAMLADLKEVRRELEQAGLLTGRFFSGVPLVARAVQSRDDYADAFTDSERDAIFASPANASAARRRTPPQSRSLVYVLLVVAALLTTAITGTLLYKRLVAPRGATGATNATSATTESVPVNKLYTQMSEAEQFAFVDAQEQRISAMMGERPMKLNEDALRSIKSYVDRYVARRGSRSIEYGAEDLNVIYERAPPYIPLIARSFAARKVPVIIGIYLPMIESEYKNCFENAFGAKGLFQFMPGTARQYGVAPEAMCDVEQMTPAAANYIADRMAELGDDSESMTLVLLSYNRGPEWVRDTLRQLRSTDNYERNFWTLFAHRDQLDEVFRKENAGYVPAFFAAAIIGENPQTFELALPPLSTLTKER